ncbi:hypothetical protein [Mycobacterium sp.]|uniref:hypothetical protein n=1 Tax=Mycobacterium sp. TaxID=1785 RepID=UPI003A8826C3
MPRPVALMVALAVALSAMVACSGSAGSAVVFGAHSASLGESLGVLGWNVSVANLRWSQDYALVDVDAAPTDPGQPHAEPEELRFGLYGALSHPLESTGLGSCDGATAGPTADSVAGPAAGPLAGPASGLHDVTRPLTAAPGRLTGTVCLGPVRDRSTVRGIYLYSPRDRIADTVAAYPAAFPVGLLPTKESDTGLVARSTSVSAWRADGMPVNRAQLGDPAAFHGQGYMLLGLEVDAVGARYRDESAGRGGPMMLLASPSLPGPGLSPACAAYGSSVLVLPDASRDAVQFRASLCTQGEINQALLYATVAIVGTHAALWTK